MPRNNFRKQAHDRLVETVLKKSVLPISLFQDNAQAGATIFGVLLPFGGELTEVFVDVEAAIGNDFTIVAELDKRDAKRTEVQANKMVLGRNNLGSFQVSVGDKLRIYVTTEDDIVASIQNVWFSAKYIT